MNYHLYQCKKEVKLTNEAGVRVTGLSSTTTYKSEIIVYNFLFYLKAVDTIGNYSK